MNENDDLEAKKEWNLIILIMRFSLLTGFLMMYFSILHDIICYDLL